MKNFLILLTVLFGWLILSVPAYAQPGCPTQTDVQTKTSTEITCFGASDGTITVDITDSAVGAGAFNFDLYDLIGGAYVTLTVTETENIAGRSVVYSNIPPGSYAVVFRRAGCPTLTITQGVTGFDISEPAELTASVASVTPACTPGTGAIAINVSGGNPGGYTYTWSGPTTISSSVEDPTGLNAGTYSVSVQDSKGCSVSLTNIVVSPPPDATINAAGSFCQTSAAVTLTAASPGGTWSGPGITNTATGTFDPASAGPGTHSITYSIGGACPVSNSRNIVVNASPDPTITSTGPFCVTSSSVTLTAATAGGTWSGPGVNAAGLFNPSAAGVGTHAITYTISGVCTVSDTENITVEASPNATITPAGPFCQTASPVNLTAATPGGTWSGPGTTSAGQFSPATAGPGTHVVSYSVTVGSCTSTSNINIVVDAPPNATITPAGPFCVTASAINLAAATPGGTWSGPGTTSAGQFTPATAGPGTHTISYSVTSGSCTSTSTINIVVDASPDATITPAGPFCETASPVNLTAATPGGTWSGPGTTSAGQFSPATAGPGTHTISYSVTSGSCTSTSNINIVVDASPDATITPAGPFCETASPVNLTAATPGGTWSGPGTTAAGQFSPATAGVGTHLISYSVTTGTCTSASTININVAASPDPTITPAGPFCTSSLSVTLTAATAGGTWSGPGTTATGVFDPAAAGAGNHVVTYTLTGTCAVSDTETIVVQAPAAAVIASPGTLCENGSVVSLTATPAGGTWSGTGITDPVAGTFDPALAGAGTVTITYSVGVGACTSVDTENIQVNTLPTATLSGTTTICSGQSASLTINLSGTAPWTVGYTDGSSGFSIPVSASPFTLNVSPGSTTTYTLTTISDAVCSASVNQSATVSVNSVALNLPATTVCENGGMVDLTTIVSATPAGGTFTFSGTGMSGQNFNPAGLSGLVQITVNYTDPGSCNAPTGVLDLTVTNALVISVPSSAVQVCQGGGVVDLNNYVSGTPGPYSFSGNAAITGNFFNPAGLSGIQNIVVNYTGPGSCTAPAVNFNFDVIATLPPLTTSSATMCASAAPVDLRTLVTVAVPGGAYTFTGLGVAPGSNMFNPSGIAGPATISISVTYTLPGCGSVTGSIPISIEDPATCLPNCFAFTVEVDAQTKRPSCNGGQDGVIALKVTALTANVLVTVYKAGDPVPAPLPNASGNVFVFSNLGEGAYQYRLEDENGTFCVQDFVWEAVTNVQATVSQTQDSRCFGTPSGSAVINATGSATGQYFYSVNGTTWTEFVSGNPVTGLPGDGTYNIRVGGSANDPCYATVSVTINQLGTAALDTAYVSPVNGLPAVSYPESPTATRVIGIEESGAAPYEVRLTLTDPFGITPNPPFIIDWTAVNETNPQSFIPQKQFDNLYAGEYELQLRDALGCMKIYSFVINLDERIFIPNIFTPNKSDNLNSTFFVRNLPADGSKLFITDRWGKEVYSSNNYNPDTLWDGGETPDGVYYYRLQIKDGKTYTGWVEILRGTRR